ncbi:Uncharacterized protein FWK35_00028537 [Aphis craccivora]|uniref:Uncharacterized protein n=1 Tax=Aphis craccivora TaxID=307492 RepID=A0A6G0Y4D1_APHCR|nr:Uncharacterized protein FWK35_00028537 [Aphis craccivora]
MKNHERSITLRKNITLTLAKKFQIKFAFLLMQPIKHNLILNPKHKIQSTDYKAGYYLTRFEDEMCLYEITEIIIMINIETIIVCK